MVQQDYNRTAAVLYNLQRFLEKYNYYLNTYTTDRNLGMWEWNLHMREQLHRIRGGIPTSCPELREEILNTPFSSSDYVFGEDPVVLLSHYKTCMRRLYDVAQGLLDNQVLLGGSVINGVALNPDIMEYLESKLNLLRKEADNVLSISPRSGDGEPELPTMSGHPMLKSPPWVMPASVPPLVMPASMSSIAHCETFLSLEETAAALREMTALRETRHAARLREMRDRLEPPYVAVDGIVMNDESTEDCEFPVRGRSQAARDFARRANLDDMLLRRRSSR